MIKYSLTNDSVTVIVDGNATTVAKGKLNYNLIRDALLNEEWDLVPNLLTPKQALGDYLHGSPFRVKDDVLEFHNGDGTYMVVPLAFADRIRASADKGESPIAYMSFFARLQKNPSARSVEQLWPFLGHQGIPVESTGHFLAYKAVNENLTDCHTGTIDNSPGLIVRVQRNKVSDDPNHACHFGLHVGSLEYASRFGTRLLIVRVDPANVVSIPHDASSQKMRVCEYEVVGFHTGDKGDGLAKPMPSTTYDVDTEWEDDEEYPDQSEVNRDALIQAYWNEQEKVLKQVNEKHLDPFADLGPMNAKALMGQSIADLRTYASKVLKIVGASKLAGGKTALVKRIMKIRK